MFLFQGFHRKLGIILDVATLAGRRDAELLGSHIMQCSDIVSHCHRVRLYHHKGILFVKFGLQPPPEEKHMKQTWCRDYIGRMEPPTIANLTHSIPFSFNM